MARIFRRLAQLLDVDTSGASVGDALVLDADGETWVPGAGGGGSGGAPTDVDYLVGTASGDLSAEIVVGTSPGGELSGTWASPTVDATHSGSSHASVQAAAEATAAAALSSHASDTTGIHGISDTSALETTAGSQSKVDTHSADTTSVHGIADTSALVVDGDAAGGVLSGTYPNPGFAADMATQAELDSHVNDTSDAHDASAVSLLDTAGRYAATDVEAAFAELCGPFLISDSGSLGSSQASFDLTSIPAVFTHLRIVILGRATGGNSTQNPQLTFNADSGNNYYSELIAASTAVTPAEGIGVAFIRVGSLPGGTAPASAYGTTVVDIPFYRSATHKSLEYIQQMRLSTSTGGSFTVVGSGQWASTSAITRITIALNANSWETSSRCILYGLL